MVSLMLHRILVASFPIRFFRNAVRFRTIAFFNRPTALGPARCNSLPVCQAFSHRYIHLFCTLLVVTSLVACQPVQPSAPTSSHDLIVALAWFNLSLKLVRETPGFTPPVASRAFAYLGVTLYQAVQPGMPGYATLAGQLNDLPVLPAPDLRTRYHWSLAANRALAVMMRHMFPNATTQNLGTIDALETHLNNQFAVEVDGAAYQASVAWGEIIADAIYIWSLSDGGHEGYARNFPADYLVPKGPGLWVRTPPAYSRPLLPYWGQNRPFALAEGNECPAPPLQYAEASDSAFYQDALEVYEVGKRVAEEEKQIALFWADNPGQTATPPGHWVSILNQIVAQQASLDIAAVAYAKLGMALADAFITCWHTKYIFNVPRPITYIQKVIDPAWNTPDITDVVVTPPFPEYTSGHSVQSSAAASVLASLFGDDIAFTDHTHAELGYPARSFASFTAAAEEAAISRLYGGIHYRAAIEHGLAQGRCVADKVLALRFQQ